MKQWIKKIWPILALLAAVAIVFFEFRMRGGPTTESWFWLFVAALIILMVGIDLYQKWTGGPKDDTDQLD